MGRCLSVLKRCSAFWQVLQALVLSSLDYCPVIWSNAAKKDLVKLQLVENKAARLVLHCNQRAYLNSMHASLSWLRVEERLTACILFLYDTLMCWKFQVVCIVNVHTTLTHTPTPPDMPPGVFSQSPGPEQIQGNVQYSIIQSHECMELPSILYGKKQVNSKPGFKKQLKQHLTAQCLSPMWPTCSVYVLTCMCNW